MFLAIVDFYILVILQTVSYWRKLLIEMREMSSRGNWVIESRERKNENEENISWIEIDKINDFFPSLTLFTLSYYKNNDFTCASRSLFFSTFLELSYKFMIPEGGSEKKSWKFLLLKCALKKSRWIGICCWHSKAECIHLKAKKNSTNLWT